MRYADVVTTSTEVAATRSRTAKVAALATLFARCEAGEVGVVVSHLSGVLPQRRLGVGWRSLTRMPDPADSPTLTVAAVDEAFTAIATAGGTGSTSRRRGLLDDLLAAATEPEQTFLRDLVVGNLRQGALDGVVQPAIAKAFDVPDAAVRRAIMLSGFAAPVAEAALAGGVAALDAVDLAVGRPLRPMLAASAPTVADAMGAAGERFVDGKLDGIRLQAHRLDGRVSLFTRSLDDITDRLPEVVEDIAALPGGDLVVDGEAIVLRPGGRPAPFQVTGSRTASSADPAAVRATTPVTTFLFDVLHADGWTLLEETALVRHEVLATLAPHLLVPRIRTEDPAEAQAFFDELVVAGHEGVVVKTADGTYAAGRRGSQWTKVKPVHTLDLVVLAVEHGSGRRRGTLSNIHLGARDGKGGFVMLGKTFKGMTDAMLAWQTERFRGLEVDDNGWVVTVRPEQVVEIALDGLQRSSRYPAGVALRFARVVRYREDKTAAEADTVDTVLALWGHGE